jgi:transcriptional regulator with XRE-family HTH domain
VITGAQIKAARVLLGWSVRDLARRASIEIADVQDVEDASKPPKRHIASIRDALEDAGIQFIDSVGVELRPVLPNEVGQETAVPAAKGKR